MSRPAMQPKKSRYLVVDDDPAIREIVPDMLDILGHDSVIARDGTEAISKFIDRSDEIDAVLLDHELPGMNGFEVFKKLRNLKPKLRVLCIGSDPPRECYTIARVDPRVGLLPKPFNASDLQQALELLSAR